MGRGELPSEAPYVDHQYKDNGRMAATMLFSFTHRAVVMVLDHVAVDVSVDARCAETLDVDTSPVQPKQKGDQLDSSSIFQYLPLTEFVHVVDVANVEIPLVHCPPHQGPLCCCYSSSDHSPCSSEICPNWSNSKLDF